MTTQDISSASATTVLTPERRRAIIAACIGNFLEWYEFALYGYFAAIFAKLFFVDDDPAVSMMLTFLVFGISFVVRPLGGVLFGHIGDRYGRKTTLSAIILTISVATALMAVVPSYASIGIAAPLLILLLRCLQGLSAGGEWMGAAAYVVESAPSHRRAFYGSWQTITIVLGLFTATATSLVLSVSLTGDQLESWGWRIPFLAALPLGMIGLYMRLKLEESIEFEEMSQTESREKSPLREAVRENWRSILLVCGLVCCPTMCTYVLLVFGPKFLAVDLGLGNSTAQTAVMVSMLLLVVLVVAFARVCDRVGRRPFILWGAVVVMVTAPIGFVLIHQGSLWTVLLGMMLILVGDAMLLAPQPALFSELFPTSRRYSGLAIGYNLGVVLFGGAGPFINTVLISATGTTYAPAMYLSAGALISLICALLVHETLGVSLRTGKVEPTG
ncbi:MHS family proline/betaine transporter-like MFS transporter [Prauserella sediminis]|uniref:Putative proline/betaine transporter n=1 Tax=Prauserella sediminis TaxID=577680 RepID=A0A839XWW4_9PSEU|nr:MFS transporter [Prauserella sediminis]MBB3664516.1 MHS family proline/betaine transporter-like MFS transporter [Prauserella sediminis]